MNGQKQVAEIVLEPSKMAPARTRYRIDDRQGHLALEAACRERGIDVKGVVSAMEEAEVDPRAMTTPELIDHIITRHHAYLAQALPMVVPLSMKVVRVHGPKNPKLRELQRVVEELADALEPHLEREEQVLFPALRSAQSAQLVRDELDTMADDHQEVARLLERMRAASDDYLIPEWGCSSYRTLIRELQALEADILRHDYLENDVLMPRFAPQEHA